jgi:hypothetical protein
MKIVGLPTFAVVDLAFAVLMGVDPVVTTKKAALEVAALRMGCLANTRHRRR